jgi:segregation and condensation protein B
MIRMGKSLKLIVEALLFASDKPLSVWEIHTALPDANVEEIKSALEALQTDYEELDRSFVLKEIADGYQFRTHSEYGPYILKMLQTSPNRLSRAALETLAIIAYKQPILRYEIERYRGVDVGGILRMLGEKGLIKIMGRKELPGRPLIYGTTKRFLEVFDLKDIESLPKLKEIEDLGAEEHEPAKTDETPSPNGENASLLREAFPQQGEATSPPREATSPPREATSPPGGTTSTEEEKLPQQRETIIPEKRTEGGDLGEEAEEVPAD